MKNINFFIITINNEHFYIINFKKFMSYLLYIIIILNFIS